MYNYKAGSTCGSRREPGMGSSLSGLCASGQNETIYNECLAKKMYSVSGRCYLFLLVFLLHPSWKPGIVRSGHGTAVGGKNLEMRSPQPLSKRHFVNSTTLVPTGFPRPPSDSLALLPCSPLTQIPPICACVSPTAPGAVAPQL